jgi:hypothetical protein
MAVCLAGCGAGEKTFRITSAAMEPTIHCGHPRPGCAADADDEVVVVKMSGSEGVQRGDIVMFESPPEAQARCGTLRPAGLLRRARLRLRTAGQMLSALVRASFLRRLPAALAGGHAGTGADRESRSEFLARLRRRGIHVAVLERPDRALAASLAAENPVENVRDGR